MRHKHHILGSGWADLEVMFELVDHHQGGVAVHHRLVLNIARAVCVSQRVDGFVEI